MEHPIKLPEDLRREWLHDGNFPFVSGTHDLLTLTKDRLNSLIDKAASWAADEELKWCCHEVQNMYSGGGRLRAARRPKPPSLKQQALQQLQAMEQAGALDCNIDAIREAIESLPDADS